MDLDSRSGLSVGEKRLGIVLRIVSLVVLLIGWEIYGRDLSHFGTPPPSIVFQALWKGLVQGDLLLSTLGTLWAVAVGLVVSLVFGIVVGFAIPLFPWAKNTLDPLIDAAYAMPVTMLIPIIGVYTGLGFRGRVFIIFTYVAMVIVIGTATGVREVDKGQIETARAFGARGLVLWRKVVFPSALPYITSSTAMGVARAVRGAVTAELLLIATNLGGFLLTSASRFDMPSLFAGIIWTLLLGYLLYTAAKGLERRLLRWRELGV
jgi:ABC-type nitrate/sulfonate/bicarbonate transport system permease component